VVAGRGWRVAPVTEGRKACSQLPVPLGMMMKNKGLTKLAKKLGISRQAVWNILHDYGYDSCPVCGGRKRTKSRVCRKCRRDGGKA